MQYSLEHLKTIVYAKFGEWAGGGERQTEFIINWGIQK